MTRSALRSLSNILLAGAVAMVVTATPALAQSSTPPTPDPQTPAQQPEQADAPQPEPERADPDLRVDPLQPDFNLAALPTTLRLPRHKWAFRVTHRFNRALGDGNFGDLLSDAFGVDSSANVGLELRFGLLRGTQLGVHRTADKTIQIFGQHNFLTERDGALMGLDALVTFEGQDNMREEHQFAFGLSTSKRVGRVLSLHAVPFVITNSNTAGESDDTTMLLGLGARFRVLSSLYLLGEITPRLVGLTNGPDQMSFGIEMRPGGHLFQINVSNGWGTTLGQLTRGGISNERWYLGFNISRKFF